VVITGLTDVGLETQGLVFRCILGLVALQWLRGLDQLG
jgi:hypothetical protein